MCAEVGGGGGGGGRRRIIFMLLFINYNTAYASLVFASIQF